MLHKKLLILCSIITIHWLSAGKIFYFPTEDEFNKKISFQHTDLATDCCVKDTILHSNRLHCVSNGTLLLGCGLISHYNLIPSKKYIFPSLPFHNIIDIWNASGWETITDVIILNGLFYEKLKETPLFISLNDAGKKIAQRLPNLETLTIHGYGMFPYEEDFFNFLQSFITHKPASLKTITISLFSNKLTLFMSMYAWSLGFDGHMFETQYILQGNDINNERLIDVYKNFEY